MTLAELAEILPAQDVGDAHIRGAMGFARQGIDGARSFIREPRNKAVVECALRIRAVETALYNLFGKGKLHGTIHTCLGQEFSGAVLGRYLGPDDYITSNHRCHGHFIAATTNWRGLIDEIIGNADGVCAGIGSSQHLWAPNFMSNGQQGGLLPVAAGIALDRKYKGDGGIVFSFIGEGTLGEGIVYETMNLDALWTLPHVIICENNFYSQSTAQGKAVSGSIAKRGEAFGLTVAEADIWDLPRFDRELKAAVDRARIDGRPTLVVLAAYRLNPHSKGDDQRDRQEIAWFRQHDPATIAIEEQSTFASLYTSFEREAEDYIESALRKPRLPGQRYFGDQLPRFGADGPLCWTPLPPESLSDRRVVQQLNHLFDEALRNDETSVFLGEDIDDPYGGAFKVAKGLKTSFGPQVLTTPISEAAIVGVGIGLGVTGRRAFVEIMFGDFITYAFDQIVNNASKIFHMYNRQLGCPMVVRTPMGGRRGYGPTHSQSLERFLIGIDNCCTISLSSVAPASLQLADLAEIRCPTLLLENKIDYAARTYVPPDGVVVESDGAVLPTFRVRLGRSHPTVTLLAYGGMARFVADALIDVFEQTDRVPELVVPTSLSPLNLFPVLDSLSRTGRLVVIEEGSGYGSVGAELIAQIAEHGLRFESRRVSGKPTPVPSQPELEAEALPSIRDLCAAIATFEGRSA